VAHGALDLLVPRVPDEQDLVVVPVEAHRLAVHLGHERAGGVDGVELAVGGTLHDGRRDPVRTEDDVRALRHLVNVIDEDGALALEGRHDVDVVHDLLAHIHRGTEALERLLDRDDGTVDAGAVAARSGEQYAFRCRDRQVAQAAALGCDAGHADGHPERPIRNTAHPTNST